MASVALFTGELPDKVVLVKKLMEQSCSTWLECVSWARNKFEKYFNHKTQQLLTNFPLNSVSRDQTNFWSYPKKAPRSIAFNADDDLHLNFVRYMALLWAKLNEVAYEESNLSDASLKENLSRVTIKSFTPKTNKPIVTDETVSRAEVQSTHAADIDLQQLANKLRFAQIKVVIF